jgi:surface protein
MFRLAYVFQQPLSDWNTMMVSDMNHMFAFTNKDSSNSFILHPSSFNTDISKLQTGNVTDMGNMFENAVEFNQSIGNWNTTRVTNISYMFKNATVFNRPLLWDTSSIITMSSAFYGAVSFNNYINHWNTSNVTHMDKLFYNAHQFNKPLNNWNTTNITTMFKMFYNASIFNQNIRVWNISPNVYLKHMFKHATSLQKLYCPIIKAKSFCVDGTPSYLFFQFDKLTDDNIHLAVEVWENNKTAADATYGDIYDWDTSKITNMNSLFYKKSSFNDNISMWNTSNVTTMYCMFSGATLFNQHLNTNGQSWDTSNVTDMQYMFSDTLNFNGNISNWNTHEVINMAGMFKNAIKFNQPINTNGFHWNTSNARYMNEMFYNAIMFTGEISGWDTSNVIDMTNIFYGVSVFETVTDYVKQTITQTVSEQVTQISDQVTSELVTYFDKKQVNCENGTVNGGNGTIYNTLYDSVGIDIYNLLYAFAQGDQNTVDDLLSYYKYTSLITRLYDTKINKNQNEMTEDEIYFEKFRLLLINSIEYAKKSSVDTNNQQIAYDELFQKYKMLTEVSGSVMSATSTLDAIAEIRPEIIRYIELYGYPGNNVFDTDKLAAIIQEIL